MTQRSLREIAEDACRALREHAEKADRYEKEYVSSRLGECEPVEDGAALMVPASEELRRALEDYADALFERTGWGAPYDATESAEP
jgi:hypothetical protein